MNDTFDELIGFLNELNHIPVENENESPAPNFPPTEEGYYHIVNYVENGRRSSFYDLNKANKFLKLLKQTFGDIQGERLFEQYYFGLIPPFSKLQKKTKEEREAEHKMKEEAEKEKIKGLSDEVLINELRDFVRTLAKDKQNLTDELFERAKKLMNYDIDIKENKGKLSQEQKDEIHRAIKGETINVERVIQPTKDDVKMYGGGIESNSRLTGTTSGANSTLTGITAPTSNTTAQNCSPENWWKYYWTNDTAHFVNEEKEEVPNNKCTCNFCKCEKNGEIEKDVQEFEDTTSTTEAQEYIVVRCPNMISQTDFISLNLDFYNKNKHRIVFLPEGCEIRTLYV